MKSGQTMKIYVACHEETSVPSYPFLYPVQVGASLTEQVFDGFYPDKVMATLEMSHSPKDCRNTYEHLVALYGEHFMGQKFGV